MRYSQSIHGIFICVGYVSGMYRVCVGYVLEHIGSEWVGKVKIGMKIETVG